MGRVLTVVVLVAVLCGLYIAGIRFDWYGEHEGAGEPTRAVVPSEVVASRAKAQAAAGGTEDRQILFGDLHVHSTFSSDAFLWSLPLMGGSGAHPVGDACDYARFCSALDFWSINDHAESQTPLKWQETKETIRQCNAVAGDPQNPDVVAFLGWEWSQAGTEAANHYGHKNVIYRDLEEDQVPTRPIGAAGIATEGLRGSRIDAPLLLPLADFANRQRYYNAARFQQEIRDVPLCAAGVDTRELPANCYEMAETPRELFEKLSQWGFDTIVIPHGTTWGFYTPPGVTLDKQLTTKENDRQRQILIEVMSGHGNSEEYRDWQAVSIDGSGQIDCPKPRADYLPSCWRAGELILARCRAAGLDDDECDRRAAEARRLYAENGVAGHLTVPGESFEEWLDAGQCRDCFLPSFNYRPGNSVQYGLSISNFDDPDPKRFRWGFIASSDNHRARPGTGYKEFARSQTTESSGPPTETWYRRVMERGPQESPDPVSRPLRPEENVIDLGFLYLEAERQASFFTTGGLAAVHSAGRSRDEIWSALKRRETYGTSGDRILLWFDLLNSPSAVAMGGEVTMSEAPRFRARAVGAFRQKPGCPEYSIRSLAPEQLRKLCKGECYNPSDERKLIHRIEVIRIRPQVRAGEDVRPLIEDPWRVFHCQPSQAGCSVEFDDPDFATAARDAAYYVRAIEEPSPTVNAGQLRCERDADGKCVRVHPCYGDYRTEPSDDCLAESEERAWSSPIYVDYSGS